METLRVGVVGAGHLGSRHAKVYSSIERTSGISLAGVCDVNEELAREVALKYNTPLFSDYNDLIGKVDAVSIVVPTSLHHRVARDLLRAGIHVLTEKPLTKTLEEADELISLAGEKDLILQVGHIERFNSAVLAIEPYLHQPRFIECQRLGSIAQKKLQHSLH